MNEGSGLLKSVLLSYWLFLAYYFFVIFVTSWAWFGPGFMYVWVAGLTLIIPIGTALAWNRYLARFLHGNYTRPIIKLGAVLLVISWLALTIYLRAADLVSHICIPPTYVECPPEPIAQTLVNMFFANLIFWALHFGGLFAGVRTSPILKSRPSLLTLNVLDPATGDSISISIGLQDTVASVIERARQQFNLPSDMEFALVHRERELEPHSTLQQLRLRDGVRLELRRKI
jgi:hypothetical protein